MGLPIGVRKLGSLKGSRGDKGAKGDPGTFAGATLTVIPAAAQPRVAITGPPAAPVANFFMPRGLPGVNAVENDEANAAYVGAPDSKMREALDKLYRRDDPLGVLRSVGGADRSVSVADSQIAHSERVWSERWLNTDAWIVGGAATVASGLVVHATGATGFLRRGIAGMGSQPFQVTSVISIKNGAAAEKITMVGVTGGTASDGSDIGGAKFCGIGVGTGSAGQLRVFSGGTFQAVSAIGDFNPSDPLPEGNWYVTVTATTEELAFFVHNDTETIGFSWGTRRADLGFAITGAAVVVGDSRGSAGNGVAPVVGAGGGRVLSGNPRTASDDLTRAFRYAVPPRHSRFTVFNRPYTYDSRRPVPIIIYAHGAGDSELDSLLATRPDAIGPVLKALVEAGFMVVASDFGGVTNWGNPESQATMVELYRHLRDAYPLGPIGLLGHSMGGLVSLSALARRELPGLEAWYGIEPVCNLDAIWAAGGFTEQVRTAYGIAANGSDYATKTAGWNPAAFEGWQFRGVPMRFIASPGDQAVPKADHTDLLSSKIAPYADVSVVAASGGHLDPTHFLPADAVAFFRSHLRG